MQQESILTSLMSQPSQPSKKTEGFNLYLKIAFTKVELGKHISFSKGKSKAPLLNLSIHPQIVFNGAASAQKSQKIDQIKIKQTDRFSDYIFEEKSPKWDCIRIEQKYSGLKPELKFKLSVDTVKKTYKTSSKELILALFASSVQKNDTSLFPLEFSENSIPLDQFMKEPYKLHVINMDFKITKQNLDLNQKKNGQRDGFVTFELVFLKDLRAQLLIRNLNLKTHAFSKYHKVGIFQILTNRNDFKNNQIRNAEKQLTEKIYIQDHINQTIEQAYINQNNANSGYCEILLQPHGWRQFRNADTYQIPFRFPLQLKNEEDQIAILFEYFDSEKIAESGAKNIVVDVLEAITNKFGEDSFGRVQKYTITAVNLIKVNDLYQKSSEPGKWQQLNIQIGKGHHRFDIQFEFSLEIRRATYQDNQPQQLIKPPKIKKTFKQSPLTNAFSNLLSGNAQTQPKKQEAAEGPKQDFEYIDSELPKDLNDS